MVIRTPPAWGYENLTHAVHALGSVDADAYASPVRGDPAVRRVGIADLREALAQGVSDFGAYRTDVVFLCVIYPLVGLLLARLAFGYEMLPLVFPLASGFALIGPLAAVGLNEMSHRREQGFAPSWMDAFAIFRSPAFGKILLLGLVLLTIFLFWLVFAQLIYDATLGPRAPVSARQFIHDMFNTRAGWAMIVGGIGVGFLLAVLALTISVVSFPMLLDRNARLDAAVRTSIRVVRTNPVTMLAWGAIVTAGLVIGSIPLLLGLVIVMPVLGHATWHLYRRAVVR